MSRGGENLVMIMNRTVRKIDSHLPRVAKDLASIQTKYVDCRTRSGLRKNYKVTMANNGEITFRMTFLSR